MSGIPRTIIGVMPRGFVDPLVAAVDAWVPGDLRLINGQENAQNHFLSVIGRLRPGVTLAQAAAELQVVSASLGEPYPRIKRRACEIHRPGLRLMAMSWVRRPKPLEFMARVRWVSSCCSPASTWLTCCSWARFPNARGEPGLAGRPGAKRGRLTRQLLTESVVLAGAGGLAGVLLARGLMPVVSALGAASIPRVSHLALNWPVLAFALAMSSASAILFGLAPALRGSRADAMGVMREQSQATTTGRSLGQLRSALVVSQVALALVLPGVAGLLLGDGRINYAA